MPSKNWYFKNVFPKLTVTPYVMTGISSMCYNGMSLWEVYEPELLMTIESLDNMHVEGMVHYFYAPDIDYTNYVTPLKEFPFVLIPSFERSIVENIKHDLRFIDEGAFLDTLERYVTGAFYNEELLYDVADYFNVSRDKIDYWVEESYGFNSNGCV